MALHLIRAENLAAQVHIGQRPTEIGFRRDLNPMLGNEYKPSGGLWTSSLDDEGLPSFWHMRDVYPIEDRDWWLVVPTAGALVLDLPSEHYGEFRKRYHVTSPDGARLSRGPK